MALKNSIGLAALLAGLCAGPVAASDWRDGFGTYNIGLLSGENEADRLRRYECLRDLMAEQLGVPVELYPASDYSGVMQGLLAGQLHQATLGASGYAGIHLQDPEAVEPVLAPSQVDGSLGYYSLILVRADSDIHSLDDLGGRTLAWADPNSASGYLYPRAELIQNGIDPDAYFASTSFAGGHEQVVVAVLNGQFDAGVTWASLMGEEKEGYSRGNLRRMVDNGLLDMNDIRIIWTSELIPNGPVVLRADLPAEARELAKEFLEGMNTSHPDCFYQTAGGEAGGFVRIEPSFYDAAIEMRRQEVESSR